MKKMQKQQAEGEDLEPRKTGNSDLDRLLNEAAIMPLAISSEEMLRLIPKAVPNNLTRFRNFKWIITGTIALTGTVLYLLLSTNKNVSEIQNTNSLINVNKNESFNSPNETSEFIKNQHNDSIDNKITTSSIKSSTPLKTIKTTKNSIYLEGTTTVILNHDERVISIELNKSGVKKIIDSGVLIGKENYSNYSADIENAYVQAGIKYNPEEANSISIQEHLAEAIIRGLHKENLLFDEESYELTLTNEEAILNGKALSNDSKLKMLKIVAQTTGKSIPPKGKIHIRH